MSEATKAVFISYAREDGAATKRICESLREAGVEVWFDADELRGGDAWDTKIRQQVKACGLFIPVISENTQVRLEGYFRLEWHLAERRMQHIHEDAPFLLPIVIDGTKGEEARVPAKFLEVQWTQLPNGEFTPAFAERVRGLLAQPATESGHSRPPVRSESRPPGGRASLVKAALSPGRWLVAIGLCMAALVVLLVWKPSRNSETPARSMAAAADPIAPAALPLSSARLLAAKATALFRNPNYTTDDLTLAEDYCKQAIKLDANDAEIWAAYAELSSEMLGGGTDRSAERFESARFQAERAVKLAPDSREAQFAKASYLRRAGSGSSKAEAEKILRGLLAETPDDPRVLIALGKAIWGNTGPGRNLPRAAEALELFHQAAAIPTGRAEALRESGWLLLTLKRNAESEAAIDESLALQSCKSAIMLKVFLTRERGDLDLARASLAKLSADVMRGDQGAAMAAGVWLWSRDPARCLEALDSITREYLTSNFFRGPTNLLRGQAYQMAGKTNAAQNAWQAALQVVDRHLVEQPRDQDLLRHRAYLLALLGARDEASTALRLYDEVSGVAPGKSTEDVIVRVLLEPPERTVEMLEWLAHQKPPQVVLGNLRLAPEFDRLRDNPGFQGLLARFIAPEPAVAEKAVAPP